MENSQLPAYKNITDKDLPQVITEAFNNISKLDKKIRDSVNKAKDAKDKAFETSKKDAGWSLGGKAKKDAIEALQDAVVTQADALSDSTDAHKELFENQKEMAKSVRYLFGLGVMNIASHRSIVRQLELQLRNASEEELSELARREIENVILQLRAQEDMQKKIDNQDEIIREHRGYILSLHEEINRFENSCSNILNEINSLKQEVLLDIDKQNKNFIDLQNDIRQTFDSLYNELDKKVSFQLKRMEESLSDKISSKFSIIEPRIECLEQFKNDELSNKSFLDSKFYKVIIGIIAIIALICSIVI